jgi:hypothetical protein
MNMQLLRCIAAGVCLAAGAIALPGCPREGSKTPTPPEAVYTVRGKIEALPEAAKPASEFRVYHEPIDNFVGADGKVVGMGTMTMPFPLAKGVSLEGLSVGDIVEVTFEVRWKSHPRTQTTKVVKLPAGTELHFGKAKR